MLAAVIAMNSSSGGGAGAVLGGARGESTLFAEEAAGLAVLSQVLCSGRAEQGQLRALKRPMANGGGGGLQLSSPASAGQC